MSNCTDISAEDLRKIIWFLVQSRHDGKVTLTATDLLSTPKEGNLMMYWDFDTLRICCERVDHK